MSVFKLLPIAALASAGVLGSNAMKKTTEVIGNMQTAATHTVEMQGIADAVAMAYTEDERLPLANFPEFLRANLREAKGGNTRDRTKDPWGTQYQIAQVTDGFEIRSAGPDTQWKTKDDLAKYYDLTGIGPAPSPSSRVEHQPTATRETTPERQAQVTYRRPPSQSAEETARKVLEFQKRRAASGSPVAQYDLGLRYLSGDGVEQDREQARRLLLKSAEGGNADARLRVSQLGWDTASANP